MSLSGALIANGCHSRGSSRFASCSHAGPAFGLFELSQQSLTISPTEGHVLDECDGGAGADGERADQPIVGVGIPEHAPPPCMSRITGRVLVASGGGTMLTSTSLTSAGTVTHWSFDGRSVDGAAWMSSGTDENDRRLHDALLRVTTFVCRPAAEPVVDAGLAYASVAGEEGALAAAIPKWRTRSTRLRRCVERCPQHHEERLFGREVDPCSVHAWQRICSTRPYSSTSVAS